MKLIDFTLYARRYRHLLTIQNAGLFVVLLVSFAWIWGSVVTLQKNYMYQRQVDANDQRIALEKVQNQTYQYQQAYYKSAEYLELSARENLNLALPGEHLVILPSSSGVKDVVVAKTTDTARTESNFSKWVDFFFNSQ